MKSKLVNFHIFKKENVISISKEKVAVNFLRHMYGLNNEDQNQLYIDENARNYENNNYDSYYEFNQLLNHNSEPNDIYLFYRDPILRYYSGIAYHLLTIYGNNILFEKYEMINLFEKYNINPYEIVYYSTTNDFDYLLSKPNYIKYFKEIIKNFLEWQIKINPIKESYIESYIGYLNQIYNRINHHNVMFVNVDKNRLINVFNKYESIFDKNLIANNAENINNSQLSFHKIIDEVFNQNKKYIEFRDDFLSEEYHFYDILEKHEKNVLNLNE